MFKGKGEVEVLMLSEYRLAPGESVTLKIHCFEFSKYVIEHSILVIQHASYNKLNKSMGGAFDPPMQVTIKCKYLRNLLLCDLQEGCAENHAQPFQEDFQ